MKKENKLYKLITDAIYDFESPDELITGKAKIELISNTDIIIENHRGIIEYGDEIMRINCGEVIMKITGTNLCLKTLTINELSLSGIIASIEYLT